MLGIGNYMTTREVIVMAQPVGNERAPKVLDQPIGIKARGQRKEFDSLGEVMVPADRYWGAQTQRSLEHFTIGHDRMPNEVHKAYGYVKKAAAMVNTDHKRLPRWKGKLIQRVADEVISGLLDDDFPLYVWQTGSGTHSNMNVNEVISNRCIQLVGGKLGSQKPIHPNDHVNMGQSSNDTFPTAMHIAGYIMATERTVPALKRLQQALAKKSRQWESVVKVGRTHLTDAAPLTVGQQWSGYAVALQDAIIELEHATSGLLPLAIGGTAVGTGLNSPAGFGDEVAGIIAKLTGHPFTTAENKFVALGTLDRMVRAHAGLKTTAVTLFKIANDMRWLGSGPRTGLAELVLPANEPGSSMMPGKVNPVVPEAVLMVCARVIGNDQTVAWAGASGNFELNVAIPVMGTSVLESIRLLTNSMRVLTDKTVVGLVANEERARALAESSPAIVTPLNRVIGYEAAAKVAKYSVEHKKTVRESVIEMGFVERGEVTLEQLDAALDVLKMTSPGL